MSIAKANTIFFAGIGGIGMSALARYFKQLGKTVTGYDKTDTFITQQLKAENIEVFFDQNPDLISKNTDLVVYTPAIKKSTLFERAKELGIPMLKRSEVLGWISKNYVSMAVAGTHGKTSTSAMLAHLLYQSEWGVNAFIGGTLTNYNTNFLCNAESECAVVEADEFDRSFLTLYPNFAIITSMDADHLDIYGKDDEVKKSFHDFARQIEADGALVVNHKWNLSKSISARVFTYGLEENSADFVGFNIRIEEGKYVFDIRFHSGEEVYNVQLGLQGRHNVENAVAAAAVAFLKGVPTETIKAGFASFKGVKRRFQYIVNREGFAFIDDYAHHPSELTACISSAREMFPGKKITGVFQPHLFSRTRDFEQGFADALSLLDELLLLDIYPAREEPIDGVSSGALLEKVTIANKQLVNKSELVTELTNRKVEVLLTMGAGDIDKEVEPIKMAFSQ